MEHYSAKHAYKENPEDLSQSSMFHWKEDEEDNSRSKVQVFAYRKINPIRGSDLRIFYIFVKILTMLKLKNISSSKTPSTFC